MSLLEIEDVYGGYGGVDILNGASLATSRGDICVIIGPNGAGKSSLMKAVFGLVKVRAGSIRFQGIEIANRRPDRVARLGIAYVPQEQNVFPSLTVQENLEMGAFLRRDDYSGRLASLYELFPRLAERRHQPAGTMSGGERQMVAMARALMTEPTLLLLDEPTAGLAPRFIDQTFERILDIRKLGITILMVEQNARQALTIADQGVVLVLGKDRLRDTGPALLNNPEVGELFLGG